MNAQKKLTVVIKQLQRAQTKEARRFYAEMLLRYHSYHPVKALS